MESSVSVSISPDGEPIPDTRLRKHIRRLNDELKRPFVLEFLDDLPEDVHPDFYRQLTRLLDVNDQENLIDYLEEFLEAESLETERESTDIQFAALYYIKTYYRRNYDTETCASFYEDYEDRFGNRIMYQFGNVIILGLKGQYVAAIRENRKIIEELSKNKDILHELAHNVATGYEEGELPESRREEYMDEAITTIEKALTLDPDYGRYYYTKARLMVLEENYELARELVERAIEKEDSNRFDYGVRISMYQSKLSRIYAEEYRNELERELESAKGDIKAARDSVEERTQELESRFLQFLGFFSGIIAVIIASVQLGAGFSFQEATQFMGLLISGLLMSFSGLGLLLPTNKLRVKLTASIVVFVMGLLSFLVAIFYVPNLIG